MGEKRAGRASRSPCRADLVSASPSESVRAKIIYHKSPMTGGNGHYTTTLFSHCPRATIKEYDLGPKTEAGAN